jgi:hypothetical protein
MHEWMTHAWSLTGRAEPRGKNRISAAFASRAKLQKWKSISQWDMRNLIENRTIAESLGSNSRLTPFKPDKFFRH